MVYFFFGGWCHGFTTLSDNNSSDASIVNMCFFFLYLHLNHGRIMHVKLLKYQKERQNSWIEHVAVALLLVLSRQKWVQNRRNENLAWIWQSQRIVGKFSVMGVWVYTSIPVFGQYTTFTQLFDDGPENLELDQFSGISLGCCSVSVVYQIWKLELNFTYCKFCILMFNFLTRHFASKSLRKTVSGLKWLPSPSCLVLCDSISVGNIENVVIDKVEPICVNGFCRFWLSAFHNFCSSCISNL